MTTETQAGCTLNNDERQIVVAYVDRNNVCSGFGAVARQFPDEDLLRTWQKNMSDCRTCEGGTNKDRVCLSAKLLNTIGVDFDNEQTIS